MDKPNIKLTPTEIAVQQQCFSEVAAVAGALGLTIFEKCATNTLREATLKRPLKPLTIDPQGYAQSMQGLLSELEKHAEDNKDDDNFGTVCEQEEKLTLVYGSDDTVLGNVEDADADASDIVSVVASKGDGGLGLVALGTGGVGRKVTSQHVKSSS